MTSSLTFTIQMPGPGEVAAHQLGAHLMMLVENNGVDDSIASAFSPYITHEAVDVHGGTKVHAAAVKNHRKRSVVERFTLCSIKRSRFRVTRRRRTEDLSATVTCTRCLGRLQKAGLL